MKVFGGFQLRVGPPERGPDPLEGRIGREGVREDRPDRFSEMPRLSNVAFRVRVSAAASKRSLRLARKMS